MSVTKLIPKAGEKSTYIISISFFDEDNAALVPDANSIKWTLTDRLGNVINSRNQAAVSSASTISIVLSGDDLAFSAADPLRIVLIEATYSSTLGTNLPIKEEVRFEIVDYVKVT